MNVIGTLLGAAVVSAIVSSGVSVYLQRRELGQQRALHLYDRRVDTYTALIDSASGVTAAVGTLGEMYDLARRTTNEMSAESFMMLHDNLSSARQAFGRAQYEALLIADDELRRLVLETSRAIAQMSETADEAQRDEGAMQRVTALAGQLMKLRDGLLDCSRQELQNLLKVSGKQR